MKNDPMTGQNQQIQVVSLQNGIQKHNRIGFKTQRNHQDKGMSSGAWVA